jgi:hypothetical protein
VAARLEVLALQTLPRRKHRTIFLLNLGGVVACDIDVLEYRNPYEIVSTLNQAFEVARVTRRLLLCDMVIMIAVLAC